MALVTVSATAGFDASSAMYAPQVSDGLVAGADIGSAAQPITPCYIKGSDGKVYPTDATGTGEASLFAGFAVRFTKTGEPVTLFGVGLKFEYAAGLTPGTKLFLAATAGRLDTVATVGDAAGIVQVVTATMVRVIRNG